MSEAKDEKAAVPPAVQQIFNGPVYGVSGQTYNQTVNAGVASETVQERVPKNLPLSHARIFVGRENALTTLHQQLQGTDRVAIASVTGMGGVGKTELALQYARANASSYPAGLCWLSAREVDLGAQILAFGRKQLGLEAPDTLDNLKDQVEWFWANWRPPTGAALVVLDDVADYGTIRDYLPSETRFKVVCTTRLQTLSLGFERLPLEVLEPQDALKLLRSLAGDERVKAEPEQAVQLCGWVGWLPLGLELVGQYLHQRQTVSLGKMLERLDKKRLEQKALLGPAYDTTAQRGVREAFDLTWQDLTPEAQTVACVLSIFALAPIPWGLVEGSLSDWDEEDLEDVRDEVLVTQSLVQDSGDGLYELHQLVREFLQEKLVIQEDAEDLKRSVGKAVVRTTSQMPQTPTIKDINESIPMLTHWQEVVRQLMNYLERDYSCIYPFVSLGRFYQWQGMYEMANYWNKECLGFMIECFGKKHHMVGISLQNIAEVYRLQGNLNKAESLFLEALEIYNLTLGYCHPEIAISLSNLGAIYKARGRYDKAELLVSRALEICLAMLGKVHFLTAKNTNNLAEIYQLKKEYKKAEPLFSRALDVFRELFGEKHPEVGIVMSNLAVTYQYQGKYERAKSLLIESLEILQGDLVGGHPLTAMIMNNLAELYRLQGKYQEAKPFYLQALRNSKTILGEEHDQVAMIMNNLAELYR
ncbi:MAG: tetratricopeptide repeat protein, partial [Cyanobacteria bacterium P01_G01_bin.54]